MLLLPPCLLAAPAILETCAECHDSNGMGGDDPMVPVIAGIPAEHIEVAIYAVCRRCEKMCKSCSHV